MKYGQLFEQESVPEWSLHNLDYNTLKHEIKVHTTRVTAIAVPGHPDPSLLKFEQSLFLELCSQHDRVGLFVTSKALELSRRLDHLQRSIQRWIAKMNHVHDNDDEQSQPRDEPNHPRRAATPSSSVAELSARQLLKRHARSAKYERELSRVTDNVNCLVRFSNAQVVALRKILKKYEKWTGSVTLGLRFHNDVLQRPASFTRRDWTQLLQRPAQLFAQIHAATPQLSEPGSPSSVEYPPDLSSSTAVASTNTSSRPSSNRSQQHAASRSHLDLLPPSSAQPIKYWNEYDNSSDAGRLDDDDDDVYAIYVNPGQDGAGWAYMQSMIVQPFEKASHWLRRASFAAEDSQEAAARRPLLASQTQDSSFAYASTVVNTDSDDEESRPASEGLPYQGYTAHYAFPSLGEQSRRRYREKILAWGAASAFVLSFVLLSICDVLISTGRHKLRIEVDVGVTLGVVSSLFCACAALGMTLYRNDKLGWLHLLMVWSTFVALCILNGMLLVLVVENTP